MPGTRSSGESSFGARGGGLPLLEPAEGRGQGQNGHRLTGFAQRLRRPTGVQFLSDLSVGEAMDGPDEMVRSLRQVLVRRRAAFMMCRPSFSCACALIVVVLSGTGERCLSTELVT